MPRPVCDYEPSMIRELVQRVGGDHVHAAHLMGCHPSTISKALQHGATTHKQEGRAAAALERLKEESCVLTQKLDPAISVAETDTVAVFEAVRATEPDHIGFVGNTVLLVSVPADKLSNFARVAQLMGVEQIPL